MTYTTLADANTYLGVTGEDELVQSMIQRAELKINSTLGIDTLAEVTSDYTTKFNGTNTYVFNFINPTVLNSIDGMPYSYSYKFNGRMLKLENAPDYTRNAFNEITFNITRGFATIPEDVTMTCLVLTEKYYKSKKVQEGVESFKQGDLTVKYSNTNNSSNNNIEDEAEAIIRSSLGKYFKNNIYSV